MPPPDSWCPLTWWANGPSDSPGRGLRWPSTRHARNGIHVGAAQVLVLGAGYDTLGWRLAPEFPGVNFFEIDHPATALLKAKGIDEMGQRENLYLIAED